MADNPEKPGPIETCRWRRNNSLRNVIARGKKRTSEAKQSKNRAAEKDTNTNGRKAFSVCGVSSSSQISAHHQGRTKGDREPNFLLPSSMETWKLEFSESEQLRSSESGSFSLVTSPEQKCADPVT
ncbi:hypothetical protein CDAR_477511 [Caerostris darwini]|uniref:Uncharacterized protein n=1 Tax=Caerostris darwini TaxID=1538125 RepID=A0AAV4RMP6_9ARAC|nr:hypothetical protein CDAR_477511 [Caerostris darwini]